MGVMLVMCDQGYVLRKMLRVSKDQKEDTTRLRSPAFTEGLISRGQVH